MESCLYLIKQYAPSLSPSERKAAHYLISAPAQAVNLSITELAEKAGTSTSAIVRLANRLGYKGFTELRRSLLKEVFSSDSGKTESYLSEITSATTVDDIIPMMVNLTAKNLAGLDAVLDREAVDKAVTVISTARNVLIVGVGASGVVAIDFQQKLARLGLLAIYTSDSDMQIVQACALDQQDSVVAISYSGETGAVLQAVKEARKNGAKVISITRIGGNSLSKLSDIILAGPNCESLFRQGATLSRINHLLVVDIIYATILSRMQDNEKGIITRTWEAVAHVGTKESRLPEA